MAAPRTDYLAAVVAELRDLLSWINHPNRKGHARVTRERARWFPRS